MRILERVITARSSVTTLGDVQVSVDGSEIVVSPGTFRISRIEYVLREGARFKVQVPKSGKDVMVLGYLVRRRDTGAVEVYVDNPGWDEKPHIFDDDEKLDLLERLFRMRVAPKTKVEDLELTCIRFIDPVLTEKQPAPVIELSDEEREQLVLEDAARRAARRAAKRSQVEAARSAARAARTATKKAVTTAQDLRDTP